MCVFVGERDGVLGWVARSACSVAGGACSGAGGPASASLPREDIRSFWGRLTANALQGPVRSSEAVLQKKVSSTALAVVLIGMKDMN